MRLLDLDKAMPKLCINRDEGFRQRFIAMYGIEAWNKLNGEYEWFYENCDECMKKQGYCGAEVEVYRLWKMSKSEVTQDAAD